MTRDMTQNPHTTCSDMIQSFLFGGMHHHRTGVVRRIRKMSEKAWKESVDYRERWNVEIYSSGLKRTMSEIIKTNRPDYIVQEIVLKVYCNTMLEIERLI